MPWWTLPAMFIGSLVGVGLGCLLLWFLLPPLERLLDKQARRRIVRVRARMGKARCGGRR